MLKSFRVKGYAAIAPDSGDRALASLELMSLALKMLVS